MVFTVCTCFFLKAQDCNYVLQGTVMDYHDKSPLIGATITITGTEKSAFSDIDGAYRVNGLCAGDYELEVYHPECATTLIPIKIADNRTYDIKLEHHLEELDEVKVMGHVIKDKTNSALEGILKTTDLETYSSGSLGDALKELTGVSSLNTGANIVKPAIHGLNGTRVLILNDGVRMQDMEWGAEHAPNVDINAAGSVSVVKGASALQYGGDAIGGVIVMEQARVPLRDTLYGKTLLNGISNGRGGNISTQLTKAYENGWFIRGQGSYKRLGDREAPAYVLSNTGVEEIGVSLNFGKHKFAWGWDAKYSYFHNTIAILRSSHIGNIDDLVRSINSGVPLIINPFTYELANPRQEVTHHLGKLSFYKRFEGLGRLNLQYDFQNNRRFEFDIRRGDREDIPAIDLDLTTHTLATDFKWDAEEALELRVGFQGIYQNNFASADTRVRRLIPDYDKYDFGAFLIGEYRFNNYWTLDAGIRYDYTKIDALKFYLNSRWAERGYDVDFPELVVDERETQVLTNPLFNYNNISTTAGFAYTSDKKDNLKFNYALAQRAPNPAELFSDGLHQSAARIELGDLRIKSETSHKLTVSYQKAFSNWGLTVEPYANWINDFIFLEPTGVEFTIRGAFPVWEYKQTDARLLGIDFSAYVDWNESIASDHSFSLVKGNDLIQNTPLINIPSANLKNSIGYSRPEWNNFEISLNSQYIFRQNETPGNIFVFSPEQQENVLLEINTAPDAYHLLGINAKLDFKLKGKIVFTPSLQVTNILDNSYRDYLNRQRFYADDLGRNIILQLKLNY